MKDLKKTLNKLEKRIRNVEENLREVFDSTGPAKRFVPGELEFQSDQLKGIADDLAKLDFPQTNIHGTGTGTE
jgi:hypothetical protein